MNIKDEILREHSKTQAIRIAKHIGNDKEKFSILMALFFDSEYRITQRAAWIVSHCHQLHPSLITPYLSKMIENLEKDISIAVKRNTVRILQSVTIPNELMGTLADICFKFLADTKETIAVRVFSMTVLSNIVQEYPEMKSELQFAIEEQMPFGSAGFISRSKKVLKQLSKL